ncbi:MAG: glycerol-3-phosphate acyltransferase [Anaerolineales bacterium]
MNETLFLARELSVIVGSYLLGCLATGYYLVRWRTGRDLRLLGSGSTGGTNAGRVLGRPGLVVTGLGDILKGVMALAAARYFHLDAWAVALAAAAVVAGHVYPIQLAFHGGRGLGPALGALLVYDGLLVALVLGLTGIFWLLSQRMTLSLMLCVAAMPLLALALGRPGGEAAGLIPIALVILAAHRQKIAAEMRGVRAGPRP